LRYVCCKQRITAPDNGDRFKPVPIIKDYSAKWARQGQAWGDESPADRMVEEMWAKYRKTLKAPTDGWEIAR
jgi:hypothetical protein